MGAGLDTGGTSTESEDKKVKVPVGWLVGTDGLPVIDPVHMVEVFANQVPFAVQEPVQEELGTADDSCADTLLVGALLVEEPKLELESPRKEEGLAVGREVASVTNDDQVLTDVTGLDGPVDVKEELLINEIEVERLLVAEEGGYVMIVSERVTMAPAEAVELMEEASEASGVPVMLATEPISVNDTANCQTMNIVVWVYTPTIATGRRSCGRR